MDITPQLSEAQKRITSYGAGQISINNTSYKNQTLLVTQTEVHPINLNEFDFELLALTMPLLPDCEILLLGTGKSGEFYAPKYHAVFKQKTSASIEAMDSGAACRTFNVLMAEGRRVAAIIFPV